MTSKQPRKVFSTIQIAELTGADIKHVREWIDSGNLRATKFEGLKDRRVHREDLKIYFRRTGLRWALKELNDQDGLPTPECEIPDYTPLPPPPRKKKPQD